VHVIVPFCWSVDDGAETAAGVEQDADRREAEDEKDAGRDQDVETDALQAVTGIPAAGT
jgi:hypothetical protein